MPGTSNKTELVTMRVDKRAMEVARARVAKSGVPLRSYLAEILELQLLRKHR